MKVKIMMSDHTMKVWFHSFLNWLYGMGGRGCVVSFMLQPHYPWGRSIQNPLNRKLGGPLLGIKPWFPRYPAFQPSQ
jgi:hypothetical protein